MKRTALALETMQLYAPMAHALDAGPLCAELEDLSLKELFPSSYRSLEQWLRGEGPADRIALDRAREWLFDPACFHRSSLRVNGRRSAESSKTVTPD